MSKHIKLHLFIDLTCHMPIGLPVVHHGLYVMHKGLPVHEESVCHVP